MSLPPEGYQSRFSDSLNRVDITLNRVDITFIPLVNVEISPLGGGEVERRDFIVVCKDHVRIAFPVAEGA